MNFSPIQFNPLWLRRLEPAARAELSDLQQESDPQLYAEGVLGLAQRQEQTGRADVAIEIYQALLQGEAVAAAPRARAQLRLDALTGRGVFGNRAEVLLRNLAREAADPSALAAMGAAGAIFRMTRLATLSRLTAASNPGILTRFLGAGRLASLAGFALEAPTFTLTARLGNEALGRAQDWSLRGLGRDFASSYLVLGGMKLAGTAGVAASSSFGAGRSMEAAFRQGSMLLGILLGHRLEQWAGLRRPQDGATTLVDSLALLLQFHVAGRLSGAAFGENFQRWERGLDLQADTLSQRFTAPRPQLALVTASGPEFRLPNHFAMSMNSNEDGSRPGQPIGNATLTPEARPESELVSTPTPETKPASPSFPVDPIAEFRRVLVPRTWVSDSAEGPVKRVWSYELVLEDLENLFQAGASRVIARRNGQDMVLKLVDSSVSSERNPFVPAGLQEYSFWVQEGEHLGKLSIYVEPKHLHLFSIYNHEGTQNRPELLPGAGTMVIDWLASQAALRGQGFNILGIQNPQIFRILSQRPFFHPQLNFVEACRFQGQGSRVLGIAPLRNERFRAQHWGPGFFNVRGNSNSDLLPAELRSASVVREGPHPYELQVEPLRNFLQPGYETILARREGRELRGRVTSVKATGRDDPMVGPGHVLVEMDLLESGERGRWQWYFGKDRLASANLETRDEQHHLPAGAGTIALDWFATQAAARRATLHLLNVKEPQIIRILERHRLLNPQGAEVEAGFYDWVYSIFQMEGRIPFDYSAMRAHLQNHARIMPPILQIVAHPNPELLPPGFLDLPKH